MAREPPWKQKGLPPRVNIMHIVSSKSIAAGYMDSCLTFSHKCLPCLLGK